MAVPLFSRCPREMYSPSMETEMTSDNLNGANMGSVRPQNENKEGEPEDEGWPTEVRIIL